MGKLEGLSSIYEEKLKTTDVPGRVLADFFCELFSKTQSRTDIILFNKLNRAYGRWPTFYSILDVYSIEKINFESSLHPLFKTVIENRLRNEGKRVPTASDDDITRLARKRKKELEEAINRVSELDIPEHYHER